VVIERIKHHFQEIREHHKEIFHEIHNHLVIKSNELSQEAKMKKRLEEIEHQRRLSLIVEERRRVEIRTQRQISQIQHHIMSEKAEHRRKLKRIEEEDSSIELRARKRQQEQRRHEIHVEELTRQRNFIAEVKYKRELQELTVKKRMENIHHIEQVHAIDVQRHLEVLSFF
jgi:hypothetical protein